MIWALARRRFRQRAVWLLMLAPALCAAILELSGSLARFDQVFYGYAAREATDIHTASPWLAALSSGLLVLLACLALRRQSSRTALLVLGAALAVALGSSLLLLRYADYWIPPSATLLMLMLSHSLWCWHNQESVLRSMDHELHRLRVEYPPVLGEMHGHARNARGPMGERLNELTRALTRVRNLQRFLTDGLDGIADPTLVSDPDGQLRFRNRAAVIYFRDLEMRIPRAGQSTAWLLEKIVADPDSMEKVRKALLGQQPTDQPAPWILDIEAQDCLGRSLILKCAPIRTDEGAFAGTVATLSDITAIREAERKREETLRFVSHDMRSPQNSILALAYLNCEEADPRKQRDGWLRIGQLARRTLRLVDDFVHLTRAESMPLARNPIDLSEILHEAMDDFWAPSQTRGIELSIDEDLPWALAQGDHALLLRAICNLLDNAVKYTPAGGRVQASLRPDGSNWEILITDSGAGIAEEDLSKLFQPFMRVGATKSDSNGAGLGLAFVHTVAWRHGGSVTVQSKPGMGSTFSLRLPACADAQAKREARAERRQQAA
jgi:signal transduction histidine kinase